MDNVNDKAKDASTDMSAEAYLRRLGERGIEYVFANAGTDFAPIVEALARPGQNKYPRFITVPHENVAMAMAHGYYRTCGKPAAVMVHVTVGTANSMNGLINAARDNIPLLLADAPWEVNSLTTEPAMRAKFMDRVPPASVLSPDISKVFGESGLNGRTSKVYQLLVAGYRRTGKIEVSVNRVSTQLPMKFLVSPCLLL